MEFISLATVQDLGYIYYILPDEIYLEKGCLPPGQVSKANIQSGGNPTNIVAIRRELAVNL